MSQMTMVFLIAGCWEWMSPPSSSVYFCVSKFSISVRLWSCLVRSSVGVYVSGCPWRFHSSMMLFGRILMSMCVSLYLYWAIQFCSA